MAHQGDHVRGGEGEVIWEIAADRVDAARKRRRRWSVALALAVAVGIPAVLAFGAFGLVYPGVVLIVVGMVVEAAHLVVRITPDQRITLVGADLVFTGTDPPREPVAPQPIVGIERFTVYPARGGFVAASNAATRVALVVVDLWLVGGERRTVIFRYARTPGRPAGADQVRLVQALRQQLPGRWREAPADDDLPTYPGTIDRRGLTRWMAQLPD